LALSINRFFGVEALMSSSIEENKTLVRRFFLAIETGDFQVFDQIVAADYDDHLPGQGRGREVLKQYFAGLRSAFPDLRLPMQAVVAAGDHVAVLNAVRGTQRGDFLGRQASGKKVDVMAFQLYRIRDRQLAEHWEVADFATLMRQLSE
jgi:steroid delta-isomerase-like uncharacterized protein